MSCTATAGAACPDLNGNGVPDCTETLVMNPGFDADTTSWSAEPGVVLSWDGAGDLAQKAGSGALAVQSKSVVKADGWVMQGAFQCVPVEAGAMYDFAAQLSVGDNPGGGAGLLSLWFFGSSDCSGSLSGLALSDQVTATSMCEYVTMTRSAPAGAGSAAVRLVAVKPNAQAPLTVKFDNVLFKKH
jgi:hypothetical protein